MVRKVKPHHMKAIQRDIDREKKNIFLCMNPAATVVSRHFEFLNAVRFHEKIQNLDFQEQERALYQLMDKEENPEDLQNQMHKDCLEKWRMRPIRLNGHYDVLNSTGTWQKF